MLNFWQLQLGLLPLDHASFFNRGLALFTWNVSHRRQICAVVLLFQMFLAYFRQGSLEWLDLHLGLDSWASSLMLATLVYPRPSLPLLRRSLMMSSCESAPFTLLGQLSSLILRQVVSLSSRLWKQSCCSSFFHSLARIGSAYDWSFSFVDIQAGFRRCCFQS